MAPQATENAQNAEGNGSPLRPEPALENVGTHEPPRTGPMQSLALEALTSRPEMAPQATENARFAEGNGAPLRSEG